MLDQINYKEKGLLALRNIGNVTEVIVKIEGKIEKEGATEVEESTLIDSAKAEAVEEATVIEAEVNIINVTLEGMKKKMLVQTTLLELHNR